MNKRFILLFIFLPLITVFFAYGCEKKDDKQVVIITIDGLRADVINQENTPGLYTLLQSGSYSLNTNTVSPSITLPAHLSLISGLTPKNHTVATNNWEEEIIKFNSKTIFSTASSKGLNSGIIVGKEKLKPLKNRADNTYFQFVEFNDQSVQLIKDTAIKYIINANTNLVLIHFPEPDITGHRSNWLSERYLEKVKEVDKIVFSLVQEIIKNNSNNDYLIIITADHGGMGNDHRIDNDQNKKIPLILLGNSIKRNNNLDIELNIYDISPTVLNFLGFNIPSNIDGNIIDDIYINK